MTSGLGKVRAPSSLLLLAALLLASPTFADAATEPESWPPQSERSKPSVPASEARLYVLAFSDIAIAQVADDVLGGVLGLSYDVDPALQGDMSLHIEQRLTPSQLLAEFEAALARSGGAMTRRDGRLVLTPRAVAPVQPRPEARPPRVAPPQPKQADTAAARPWLILAGFALAGALLAMLALIRLLPPVRASGVGLTIAGPGSAARRAVLDHLLAQGAVAPEVMERAQRLADSAGRPVERVLHGMGAVTDAQLVDAYMAVTGCAAWRPQDQPPLADPGAADGLASRGLVLVARGPRRIVVATADPLDDDAIAAVSRETARTVGILVGSPSDIAAACGTSDPSVIPYDPAHSRASG